MQFHSSSIDGAAGCFSEQGPAQSECATNPLGDFFNTPLRIAGLQRMLRRQGMSFWWWDHRTVAGMRIFSVRNVWINDKSNKQGRSRRDSNPRTSALKIAESYVFPLSHGVMPAQNLYFTKLYNIPEMINHVGSAKKSTIHIWNFWKNDLKLTLFWFFGPNFRTVPKKIKKFCNSWMLTNMWTWDKQKNFLSGEQTCCLIRSLRLYRINTSISWLVLKWKYVCFSFFSGLL